MKAAATRLDEAYKVCHAIVKHEARNFYYGFQLLPRKRRQAIYAVYAFCRLCDDAVDNFDSVRTKKSRLDRYRAELDAAATGTASDSPVFTALSDVIRRYRIPTRLFHELIDGMAQDLQVTRYEDEDALRRYCYLAASTVGLICLPIFGCYEPAAEKHAIDLGLAMQWTNILRDIKEDVERDRIYLPRTVLQRHGYSEKELRHGIVNDAFRRLMAEQTATARAYYASGRRLWSYLPLSTRSCPQLMHDVYSAILDKIEAADYNIFSERIGPTRFEQWRILFRFWTRTFIPSRAS